MNWNEKNFFKSNNSEGGGSRKGVEELKKKFLCNLYLVFVVTDRVSGQILIADELSLNFSEDFTGNDN